MHEACKRLLSIHTTNKINKIGLALELGEALSYQGGMDNTMAQVITTNKQVTFNIEKKFEDVTKGFLKYFSRVNHAYLTTNTIVGLRSSELHTESKNNDTCIEIIDHIKFDVGVQSFSNIDKIINFHIDMTKSKSKQIEPEQSVLDEIKDILSNIGSNNNQHLSSTINTNDNRTTFDTNNNQPTVPNQPISDDIRNVIAGFRVEDEDISTNSYDDDSLFEVQSDDHSNDDSIF